MALDKLVDSSQLDGAMGSTADAIREKTGGEGLLTWDLTTGFADAIGAISTLDEETADATATSSDILNGKTAYVQGEKVTGNIPTKTALTVNGKTVTAPAGYYASDTPASVAVGTATSGTASITSLTKTYNSTSGKFDVTGSANVSAPTVGTAGYVSSTEGTKNAKTGGATVSAELNKITGSTAITGTLKVTPSILKQSTPSGVTNAASGNATTTAPSSGVYVAVKATGGTNTITATPSVSTEGYGTAVSHGITGNTANVGANDSAVTYVPITTGSVTQNAPTVNSSTGLVTATSTVTEGYVGADTKSNMLQLSTQGAQTITPGTTDQEIAAGKYLTGKQTISGDADLIAANIKKGVDIFGVTGTFTTTPSGKTALAAEALRSGYAGFINGSQVNGSMPDATFANTGTSGITYTDVSSTAPVLVSGDYLYVNGGYSGNVKMSLAKLVPDGSDVKGHDEYILSGHSAYDDDGTLVAGSIPTIASTDLTVDGKTVTVPVGYYTGASGATAVSADVAEGAYSASVISASISTAPTYTPATSGSITDISTETQPSGTDGTDYWTITPSGTKTNGNARSKARATISTAGYIAAGSKDTSSYTNKSIVITENAGTTTYIPKAVIAGSSTNATATTTVAPGTVSISKQSTPSGVTNAASGDATTTAPSSGVYVAVKATAAANTTGTTSSISGSGSATVTTAGYAPSALTGTVSVSGTATAKTSSKDSSVTYVPITTAEPTVAIDPLWTGGKATAEGTNCTLSSTNNGIKIQTKCTTDAVNLYYYGSDVNGWVSKSAGDVAGSVAATSKNGQAYYIQNVTVPDGKNFTVTLQNGTSSSASSILTTNVGEYRSALVQTQANSTTNVDDIGTTYYGANSATVGTLTVSAYNASGTAENNKSIVSAGKWVETSTSTPGTYYGKVVLPAGTCLPSGNIELTTNASTDVSTKATATVRSAVFSNMSGGGLSGTATASGSGADLSTSTNDSGITITTACTATRAKVSCATSTAGWASGTVKELAATSTAMTATTYYLNGVTLPKSKSFSITVYTGASTQTTFVFTTDANGNTTVAET